MSQSTSPAQRLLNLEANEFKKINGTSSQFLKADGSVDSNTYLTSVTGDWTGTFDGQEGSYYLNYNNLTNLPTLAPSNAEQNVQSDWNATSGDALILNKPTIPTNNNQLTNGAGYVTSSGNTVIGTDSDINTSNAYVLDTLVMTDGVVTSHTTRELKQLAAIDDRDMAPEDVDYSVDFATYFSSKGGLDTGTTADSNYQDVLLLSTYSDASGGNPNILSFDKSEKKIYHYQNSATATSWGTPEVLAYVSDIPSAYSHPTYNGDDFSVDSGALTGATVISDIDINVTTDSLGHVTDANGTVSTRTLTLADLGFTGDTDATNDQDLSGYLLKSGGTMTGNLIMADETINFKTGGSSTLAQFTGHRSNTDLDSRHWATEGGWAYTTFESSSSNLPTSGLHNANGLLSFNTHSGNYGHQIAMATSPGELYHRHRNNSSWQDWEQIWTSKEFDNNSANWDTAYGWGDHSTEGYLTSASIGSFVDGSGTANKIVKWTDSDTIEDSIITEVSSEIGIGVASPKAKLHVNGAVIVGDDQTTGSSNLAEMAGAIRYWEETVSGGYVYSYCDMVMKTGCNYSWVNIVTNKNQCI